MSNSIIKCNKCETYNAKKILQEGRWFIICKHCGLEDYLKTFNTKQNANNIPQFQRKH